MIFMLEEQTSGWDRVIPMDYPHLPEEPIFISFGQWTPFEPYLSHIECIGKICLPLRKEDYNINR